MASVVLEHKSENSAPWTIAAWQGEALPQTVANADLLSTPALRQTADNLASTLMDSTHGDIAVTNTVIQKADLHAKIFEDLAAQAGYKYRGQGIVPQGMGKRLLKTLAGDAETRYQCATLRAQQGALAPIIQHLYTAQKTANFQSPLQRWQDVQAGIQSSSVTKAILSLDNTPSLQKLDTEVLKSLGRTERGIVQLNRWAFGINGVNEIIVSLTGVCCKILKKCFFPKDQEHKGRTGLKILAALAAITLATAALSRAFFGKLTNPWLASVVHEFTACTVRLVCSINAVGFLLAAIGSCLGLTSSIARSQIKSALPEPLQKQVEANWQENINRLGAVVFAATEQSEIHFFLCQAFQAKIGKQKDSKQYTIKTAQNTSLTYHAPVLVEQLVDVFKTHQKLGTASQERLFWAISDTLGQYMDEPSTARDKAERTIHVRKLFGLVQNSRIDAPNNLAKDARQTAEELFARTRTGVLKLLGDGFAACHLDKISHWCKRSAAQTEAQDPENDTASAYSLRHITQNKHQHSRLTLGLAKISLGLRHFNTHVVLCRNGLLARFFSKGLRLLAYKALKVDLGILQSFMLGRALSCGCWAVLEAMALAYSVGQSHGFQSSLTTTTGPGPFPLKLALGRSVFLLTVINTALQMLLVHSLALAFQGLAFACAWADTHLWGLAKADDQALAQQEQHKLVFYRPQLHSTNNPF